MGVVANGAGATRGPGGRAGLSVVVPTRNASRTIARCVAGALASPSVCEVIVVDNGSSDATLRLARSAGACCVVAGPERSAQRNEGLRLARGHAVAFLDADMRATEGVLDEALARVDAGADAVILSERSIGEGYWAAVRALERACYVGRDEIEACRVFRTEFVRDLGGFDERLDAFEDWDLTARARAAGARVERTVRFVEHDEGRLTLAQAVGKKARYARWMERYRAKHPNLARAQLRPWKRLRPFVESYAALLREPHLALGIVALKSLELAAARLERRAAARPPPRAR